MRFLPRYGTGRITVSLCQILPTTVQAILVDAFVGTITRKVLVSFC